MEKSKDFLLLTEILQQGTGDCKAVHDVVSPPFFRDDNWYRTAVTESFAVPERALSGYGKRISKNGVPYSNFEVSNRSDSFPSRNEASSFFSRVPSRFRA